MLNFLITHFIPNSDDISNPEVRERYGTLGGTLGIVCNLLLFAIKLTAGAAINSIAVISDAFNNLSDLGSSLVSVIGARLSGKRADKEHPYGHGRAEYISALIISFLILFFGAELLKSSVVKIFKPEEVKLNIVSVVLLVLSVPVKLWMWHYNRVMGKKINSAILMAASKDSLNDTIATSAVIVSALLAYVIPFPIDGIAGICVSALVIWTGVQIAHSTTDRLMGVAPDEKLIEQIEKTITDEKCITGMHDLLVHDYGPGHKIASAHAEISADMSLTDAHDVIDRVEHKIMNELGVDIVIHMDPVRGRSIKGQ